MIDIGLDLTQGEALDVLSAMAEIEVSRLSCSAQELCFLLLHNPPGAKLCTMSGPTVGINGAADHGARVRIARLRANRQRGDAALGNKAAQCSNIAWWPHHAPGNREPLAAAPSTGAHNFSHFSHCVWCKLNPVIEYICNCHFEDRHDWQFSISTHLYPSSL
jgi:hypothetical protein